MKKKKLKGIWIPIEILKNNQLSDKEKLLFSIILSLSNETGYCYANNRYLSNILGITIGRVSKLISSLKKKGLIEVNLVYEQDSKKIEERRIVPMVIFNHTSWQKELYPMARINKDIINKYKKFYSRGNFTRRKYTKEEIEKWYANRK